MKNLINKKNSQAMILKNSLFPSLIIIFLSNFSTFSAQKLQVLLNQDVNASFLMIVIFRIFDFDNDGTLSKQDIMAGIKILFTDPHTKENLMN